MVVGVLQCTCWCVQECHTRHEVAAKPCILDHVARCAVVETSTTVLGARNMSTIAAMTYRDAVPRRSMPALSAGRSESWLHAKTIFEDGGGLLTAMGKKRAERVRMLLNDAAMALWSRLLFEIAANYICT